ncbi:hypothetical protein VWY69_00210 [Phaeobacter sp. A90a-4k]|uniref:hypothetical protein n=1 Tax=unclassified Phaeobacter TaxID=2621772 RepID=UPI003A8589C3
MRLAFVLLAIATAEASAQETCTEPYRPDAEFLVDGGYDGQEMREEYRIYFSEVEDYLNCVNISAARIRQEAIAAAQDYNRVLDRHPVTAGVSIERKLVPDVELSESGTLFLDPNAGWLR